MACYAVIGRGTWILAPSGHSLIIHARGRRSPRALQALLHWKSATGVAASEWAARQDVALASGQWPPLLTAATDLRVLDEEMFPMMST